MDNLLNELDVVKLARALPDGQEREIAIQKASELLFWAERAIAESGEDEGNEEPEVSVLRGSGGGRGGRQR